MTRLFPLTALLASVLFLAEVSSVAALTHLNTPRHRHQQLNNRLSSNVVVEDQPVKQLRKRKSCAPRHITNGTTSTSATTGTTHAAAPPPTSKSSGGGVGNLMAANWPSQTQPGAAPAATVTSTADPYLEELSKAYNNAGNALFTQVHTGQMTYYGQGLGACGDTYNDSSFTAAVSHLMYDAWPGADADEENRNPICGPFVTGRKIISASGSYQVAVPGSSYVIVGGDGLLNCDTTSQCHVPLTATVKHGDKSIQVEIVDRCAACLVGDIDLTPTAFAALADPSLGRTNVQWFFNQS